MFSICIFSHLKGVLIQNILQMPNHTKQFVIIANDSHSPKCQVQIKKVQKYNAKNIIISKCTFNLLINNYTNSK